MGGMKPEWRHMFRRHVLLQYCRDEVPLPRAFLSLTTCKYGSLSEMISRACGPSSLLLFKCDCCLVLGVCRTKPSACYTQSAVSVLVEGNSPAARRPVKGAALVGKDVGKLLNEIQDCQYI